MQALDLRAIEPMEITSAIDPTRRVRVAFPMSSATGAAASASVCFEVAPGEHVGVHTDSDEELLDIVEGRGEGVVGEETAPVETGPQVFVIGAPMPVMLPSNEAIPA